MPGQVLLQTPPNNNTAAPINISANSQIKSGGLGVASLLVTGKAQSASTLATDAGTTLVTKDYVDSRLPVNCTTRIIPHATGKALCGARPAIPLPTYS